MSGGALPARLTLDSDPLFDGALRGAARADPTRPDLSPSSLSAQIHSDAFQP